jgi:uncharacterized transporter YbjL
MTPLLLVSYVALCLVVGYGGRNWRIGFFGCFILSVILTPLIVGIAVLMSTPRNIS